MLVLQLCHLDNHVPRCPEGGRKDDFWQIIPEISILLILRGRVGASMRTPLVKIVGPKLADTNTNKDDD